MYNLLLAILLLSATGTNIDNYKTLEKSGLDNMKIQWQSINTTGVILSQDNNYSLSGNLSQSPISMINYSNTNINPFGIISGFWSAECDVHFNVNPSKESFPLSNDKLSFKLYANYPNPFRRTTQIKYDIPCLSEVSVIIYDICGREVKSLINSKQDIGQYAVSWDGKDETGNNCSDGIYFITLKTDNNKEIKKIIIAK